MTPYTSPPAALNTSPQNCLLCGNTAQYHYVERRTRKHFLCSHCTQYQIATIAEARLTTAPPELRASLAEMSRSHPQGATLVITQPSEPHESANAAALAHEY